MVNQTLCVALFGLFLLMLMLGCQGGGTGISLPFEGPQWNLIKLEGKPLQEESKITLQVSGGDAAGGQVSGFAGINRYFGAVVRQGDQEVDFGAMGSTRMAGPPALMEQEATYLRLLQEAGSLKISGDQLQLMRNGSVVLVYRAAE